MEMKTSSLLKKAAEKAALDMIEKDLSEIDIPGMESFHLSKEETPPTGYQEIEKIEVKGIAFYIFQRS